MAHVIDVPSPPPTHTQPPPSPPPHSPSSPTLRTHSRRRPGGTTTSKSSQRRARPRGARSSSSSSKRRKKKARRKRKSSSSSSSRSSAVSRALASTSLGALVTQCVSVLASWWPLLVTLFLCVFFLHLGSVESPAEDYALAQSSGGDWLFGLGGPGAASEHGGTQDDKGQDGMLLTGPEVPSTDSSWRRYLPPPGAEDELPSHFTEQCIAESPECEFWLFEHPNDRVEVSAGARLSTDGRFRAAPRRMRQARFSECCATHGPRSGFRFLTRPLLEIMNEHDIRYWLDGSALLGQARLGLPHPWDHDELDVSVFDDDFHRFQAVAKPLLMQQGFTFRTCSDANRFSWLSACSYAYVMRHNNATAPLRVRLFRAHLLDKDQHVAYVDSSWRSPRQTARFLAEDIFPLQPCKFLGTDALCPQLADQYTASWFKQIRHTSTTVPLRFRSIIYTPHQNLPQWLYNARSIFRIYRRVQPATA